MTEQVEMDLSKHWHVVVYVIGLVFFSAVTITTTTMANEEQDKTLEELQEHVESDNVRELEDAKLLAGIVANQKNFVEDVKELKEGQKETQEILREILQKID